MGPCSLRSRDGSRPFARPDWTEFDADNQSTIALYLVTKHGRATPLLWKTVACAAPVREKV